MKLAVLVIGVKRVRVNKRQKKKNLKTFRRLLKKYITPKGVWLLALRDLEGCKDD